MKGMGAWNVIKELGFKGLYKVKYRPLKGKEKAYTSLKKVGFKSLC